MINFCNGILTAMITPFDEKGVNSEEFGRMIEYQIEGGTSALVVLGTTGEPATMTEDEKEQVIKYAVKRAAGRIKIIVGTGSNDTKKAVAASVKAEKLGADGVLAVTPYYNKCTQKGLYDYYKAICDAVSIPVIAYNVPSRTGKDMEAHTTLRLAREFQGKIIGVKEASGNLGQVSEIIDGKPEGFQVVSGDDSLTLNMLRMGAEGVISVIGNAFPKEFSRMVRLALEGDYANALLIHHRFTELFSLLFVDGNPAGVKCLLHAMGFMENELRLPLVPTRITTYEKIHRVLDTLVK